MRARGFLRFSVLTLVAVLTAHAATANAAPNQEIFLSDSMIVKSANGTVLFDNFTADALGETTLTFTPGNPNNVLPPPLPPATAITVPGANVIVLTEPAGEPPDPTEPPVTINGLVVSDILISTLANPSGAQPFIMLVSDFADLQGITSLPANAVILPEPLPEAPVDVTPFLSVGPLGPFNVMIQSDAVPEPGTFLLFSAGVAGLAAVGTRRHRT